MPGRQADHSWTSLDWQDDGWQDGSSSSGWQADGGSGMYSGVQAAEGWCVRPGPGPRHPSSWLAGRSSNCQRAPPIPEEQPLTPNEFLCGFKAGYDAAYLTGWEQGYHMGEIHTLQMRQDEQYQGYQTNRRGASPDW